VDLLEDLEARGLIHDSTDRDALAARLGAEPVVLYHGIDPSSDSLHTGNLIGLMMLRRFQLAGHRPIALAGGATGMIGDPGGRSEERNLLDEDTLRANVAAIKSQISRVLGDEGEWTLVDNYEWTRDVPLLSFLRDVGKYVTVNQMMARESVRARVNSEHGISYTEFSYMLLQAFDYWWLHEHEGCELQIGGSDQWGNILSGVDLIRRRSSVAVHALCWPLLLGSDGTKLGKTTGARIWLDPAKTSPYELFQHFVQTDDREVRQLLLWLTLLPVEEIDEVIRRHKQSPQHREAQRLLAREVVTLVHGAEAANEAEKGISAWSSDLSSDLLRSLETSLPTTELRAGELPAGIVELLVRTELAASKSAATRLVRQGGAYANDRKVEDESRAIDAGDFIEGRWLLLRAGKRQQHLVLRASSG
jgi:tyrosyl-tRNA synthetase